MEGLETQGGGRRTCVLSEMGVPEAYPRAEKRSEEHSPEWALWWEGSLCHDEVEGDRAGRQTQC